MTEGCSATQRTLDIVVFLNQRRESSSGLWRPSFRPPSTVSVGTDDLVNTVLDQINSNKGMPAIRDDPGLRNAERADHLWDGVTLIFFRGILFGHYCREP